MLCCRNTIRNERFDSQPASNHNSCHCNGRSEGICWSTRSEVPHKWTHGHIKWLSLYLYYHSALCLALRRAGACLNSCSAGLVSTRACVLLKKTLLWKKSTAENELYLFCCCISQKWTLSDEWCDYLKIVCVHGL